MLSEAAPAAELCRSAALRLIVRWFSKMQLQALWIVEVRTVSPSASAPKRPRGDHVAFPFSCPTCSQVDAFPMKAAGNKGTCPKCGQKLRIPTPPKPTPTPTSKNCYWTLEGAQFMAMFLMLHSGGSDAPPLAPSPNATQNEQSHHPAIFWKRVGGQPA